ncbi:MAG: hypothetical protein D6740_13525 [Alphaproteobacteria bacterium]|nr:MAG: hypothetical protein D6740_13525 [Alphaproteobacteria bacterium]
MAKVPSLTDYVSLIITLFELFKQNRSEHEAKLGCPFTYTEEMFIIFFMLMQFRQIHTFKAQWRWLTKHPDILEMLGWTTVPHRTTISRRYKALYDVVQEFVLFIGQYAPDLDEQFSQAHLVEDKSLFKALGPVWHQSDRKEGRIPKKLRKLDTDATWSKSGYHGWVYGYAVHITCNEEAFPAIVQVETASVSESEVLQEKEAIILERLQPETLAADNAYTQAMRIRRWAKRGVALLTPALKWTQGRFAQAYHRFIKLPDVAVHLKKRRTSIEPLFDLIAKVVGTTAKQKQLPVQGIENVCSCLALATLSVQIAMLANSIWGLPPRNISEMASAFQ